MSPEPVIQALRQHAPSLMRWAGALARNLRQFNIALAGKHSGNANTDALTLADLTVQELLVAGLRDADPVLKTCRIEAEETTGDLAAFAKDSPLVIALDPIDGTKQFRDRTGNGYAVMLHLRDRATVLYSLVYAPETGPMGTWVEAYQGVVKCGSDDFSKSANQILDSFPNITPATRPESKSVYLIGFQNRDVECARAVTKAGLKGFAPDEMPGSIYPLLATGEFGGSLIHSPNIYDFPVSLHIARILGGEAVWVHNSQPVSFDEMWMDDRADMLRLPGIVACAVNRDHLKTLCELAKDWNPVRYVD